MSKAWLKFRLAVLTAACRNLVHEEFVPIMEQMRDLYPPSTKFGVTKTEHVMVEEAYSGCVEDISGFVIDGLQRMKVGTTDGPPFLNIVGDEQIFRQMNELRRTCPEEFGRILAQLGVRCPATKKKKKKKRNTI